MVAAPPAARAQDGMLAPTIDVFEEPFTAADLRLLAETVSLTDDQKAMARELLAGAKAEFNAAERRAARVYHRTNMKQFAGMLDDRKSQDEWAKTEREWRGAVIKSESQLMDDLKLLLDDEQARKWPTYLSRRMQKLLPTVQGAALPELETILKQVELSGAEREGAAEAIAAYDKEVDRISRELCSVRIELRRAMYETDRNTDSNARRDASQKAEVAEEALGKRFDDAVKRAARSIAAGLTPERGALLNTTVDVWAVRRELGVSFAERSRTIRDYLKISTLTAEQRARILELCREVDRELTMKMRNAAHDREMRNQGGPSREKFEQALEESRKAAFARFLALEEKVQGVLTPAQRAAFEAGQEPSGKLSASWWWYDQGEDDPDQHPDE